MTTMTTTTTKQTKQRTATPFRSAGRLLPCLLAGLVALGGCSRPAAAQDANELIRGLSAPDAADRAFAACELERMGASAVRRAMPRLLELLPDDTPVEGRVCRDGTGWRRGWYEDSSPGREAAIALEEAGAEALEPLVRIVADGTPAAREHAALALGLIEDARAVDALEDRLRSDETTAVRERAAWALGMIEDAAAVPALARALADASPDVREQSAWALGMIESSAGVDPLTAAMRDASPEVREKAAWALGMIESAEGVEALAAAIDDESADVRKQAAWALGMIEDPRAAGPLSDALEDDDEDVRDQAIWALGMVVRNADIESIDTSELARRLRKSLEDE